MSGERCLPKGWREVRLGEVSEVVRGGTPKTKVAEFWNGEHPWVTPAEMRRDNPYVATTKRQITTLGLTSSAARLIPANSLILSTRAPVGYLIINTQSMAFNQGCLGLVPSNSLNYLFLYFYLSSSEAQKALKSMATGTTFDELKMTELKQLYIPLPPLGEQRHIASILEQWDQAIAATQTLISQYKAQKQGLMQQLLTGERRVCDD